MSRLRKISKFVVLMLENRSFDHVLGYSKKANSSIDGIAGTDFNYEDPLKKQKKVYVRRATASALPFDPGHEFPDVKIQLYGPAVGGGANPPKKKAPMSGFVRSSAISGGKGANKVMECFEADQLPVLTTLAAQFGVLNYWYSSMPGPTWPNRFFVHAGTSGGLTDSPGKMEAVRGFNFKNGTIYDRLAAAKLGWRIYHTDIPQVIGIRNVRKHYLSGYHFRHFDSFQDDVTAGDLPEYTFIEPHYDVFNDFVNGNSMHPQNDVAHGEKLVKDVYEAIRGAAIWDKTMLIVTFDEHGGFYDHNSPPTARSTGDDTRYATKGLSFKFDRYGVRVPTIVVSAYTKAGTVIGKDSNDPNDVFDHCSILSTVGKRFGLASMTNRDKKANTLEALLNLDAGRKDAPAKLPKAKTPLRNFPAKALRAVGKRGVNKPLDKTQEAFLGLAIACDMELRGVSGRRSLAALPAAPRTKGAADKYAHNVQRRILAQRSKSR